MAWLVACVALLCAAPAARAQDDRSLVVGSKSFTENRILAHVIGLLVEDRLGVEVSMRDGLGGTLVAFEALRAGEIDVYPEYTGTGWAVVLKEAERASDPLRTYLHVAREYERLYAIRWMPPFGFNNGYALAVREDVAERYGLLRVSDLAAHAGQLKGGVSHEFLNREDGWPGLSAAYGLELADLRGMEHGLAFEAIDAGEIDVIDAYTTDGKLLRYDVRVLLDDRGFWPPYQCAPIVRVDALARYPGLAEVMDELAFTLPDARMQRLNYEVEVEDRSFRDVARRFLVDEGLLEEAGPAAGKRPSAGDRRGDLLAFVKGRLPATLDLTLQHLLLTALSVLGAVLLAVPLGILLTRRPGLAAPVLGAAGVIQTVPSLALIAFMIPVLGLGLDAALAALFLYALLPILRNTYTGIREVDADLTEAARGMGLHPHQVLLRVELPLATRTIMAGIRTATVITIGVATLAAFIGAGGLGEPIVTGLQLNDTRLVLAGAVPAALLAILADLLLEWVERRLTPGGGAPRRRRASR
ncbi:MAG: glycine betaine ABC transporter substrate-binding protein [Planctomycetota bacterium]